MAVLDVRLVIATHDTAFYNLLNVGLLRLGGVGVISNVNSVSLAESKFDKHKSNILILDIDRSIVNYAHLKLMLEKYRLLIILTGESLALALPFMKGGIQDFIPKPQKGESFLFDNYVRRMTEKMKGFAAGAVKLNVVDLHRKVDENQKIIAVASSTGGTEALETILRNLPSDILPMLVVQHMPSGFTKLFADRLQNICRMEVREASNNDYLQKGVVYIAPAGFHMKLVKSNSKLSLQCFTGNKIHGVMPAADVLFDSIAPIMKSNAIGVILTGMGSDGAKGLYKMHINGAKTIGQNKETCVVYGMPKAACDLGAVDQQLPIGDIAPAILKLCNGKR